VLIFEKYLISEQRVWNYTNLHLSFCFKHFKFPNPIFTILFPEDQILFTTILAMHKKNKHSSFRKKIFKICCHSLSFTTLTFHQIFPILFPFIPILLPFIPILLPCFSILLPFVHILLHFILLF